MFLINEDMSIYLTRGDAIYFTVTADENGKYYKFKPGDVLRIKVFEKKNCENVVLVKEFPVDIETERVEILLTKVDTKIGEVISKPVDYWYEIELNPFTNPQTIIGYDDDGAKVFRLFPEGTDPDDAPGGGTYDFEIAGTFDENGLFFGWQVYSAIAVNEGFKKLRKELTEAFDKKLEGKADNSSVKEIRETLGNKAEKTDLDAKADKKDLEEKVNRGELDVYAKKSDLDYLASSYELQQLRAEILGELSELSAMIGEVT